ncbi:hypothetical protein [Pseudomonas sp. NKUCC02_KPG]|uniref:hypothetical protein n=1 Tax=Pseudomonas sp. NKUCC02_KPG TaxID=2842124 RepID=UPI001C5B723A|nr:hypothetical protein [Pseudomonas sp. NKUCC02_KPG]MBW3503623.1 hypothetical protein [Pseudomonas sp. NKUCC02_KPG]
MSLIDRGVWIAAFVPRQRLQIRHELRVVVADEWNEAAIEREAIAKADASMSLIDRGVCIAAFVPRQRLQVDGDGSDITSRI